MAPDSALLFVILSPVSAYYKASNDGAVSIFADPNVVRAFPGGVGNRKVGSNYGPTIGKTVHIAKTCAKIIVQLEIRDPQIMYALILFIFLIK